MSSLEPIHRIYIKSLYHTTYSMLKQKQCMAKVRTDFECSCTNTCKLPRHLLCSITHYVTGPITFSVYEGNPPHEREG